MIDIESLKGVFGEIPDDDGEKTDVMLENYGRVVSADLAITRRFNGG